MDRCYKIQFPGGRTDVVSINCLNLAVMSPTSHMIPPELVNSLSQADDSTEQNTVIKRNPVQSVRFKR